jgi:hypothetical protein
MNPFRQMVAQAVLAGQISEQNLTLEEIKELEQQALEAAMEKEMDAAVERGCSVFDGIEGDTLQ